MKFNQNYTNYWQSSVEKSIDNLKIPGQNEIANFLALINFSQSDLILDLGCSYGRNFELLNKFSSNIYGVDPEISALKMAAKYGYRKLNIGIAEKTKQPNQFFDFIFCWAVFDIVDQNLALIEANRILKINGKLLLTGKSDNYLSSDKPAFNAKKNAYLKSFPNKFTNLYQFINNLDNFGLCLDQLYIFKRRGDFGAGIFKKIKEFENLFSVNCYEYVLLCTKKRNIDIKSKIRIDKIYSDFSKTGNLLANLAGFSNVTDYFSFLGMD
jgi:SAM-dependent methyltransferase